MRVLSTVFCTAVALSVGDAAGAQPASSPAACPWLVDAAGARVVPQRMRLDGARLACAPDWRMAEALRSDDNCPWLPLPAERRAVEQLRLVHKSPSGLVEIAPCRPTAGSRAVALRETTAGCQLSHRWAEGASLEATRWVFERAGAEVEAVPCLARDDRRLQHRRVACAPLALQLARAGAVQIPTERIEAAADGRSIAVRDCQPVEGAGVATASGKATIAAETGPCDGTIADGAGESYGTRRFVLAWPDGRAEPATQCLADVARAYAHNETPAGWRHDDVAAVSYPLSQAIASLGTSERRLGTAKASVHGIAWHLVSQSPEATGTSERLGCWTLRHRRMAAVFRRPDGSELRRWLGQAEAIADGSACR